MSEEIAKNIENELRQDILALFDWLKTADVPPLKAVSLLLGSAMIVLDNMIREGDDDKEMKASMTAFGNSVGETLIAGGPHAVCGALAQLCVDIPTVTKETWAFREAEGIVHDVQK